MTHVTLSDTGFGGTAVAALLAAASTATPPTLRRLCLASCSGRGGGGGHRRGGRAVRAAAGAGRPPGRRQAAVWPAGSARGGGVRCGGGAAGEAKAGHGVCRDALLAGVPRRGARQPPWRREWRIGSFTCCPPLSPRRYMLVARGGVAQSSMAGAPGGPTCRAADRRPIHLPAGAVSGDGPVAGVRQRAGRRCGGVGEGRSIAAANTTVGAVVAAATAAADAATTAPDAATSFQLPLPPTRMSRPPPRRSPACSCRVAARSVPLRPASGGHPAHPATQCLLVHTPRPWPPRLLTPVASRASFPALCGTLATVAAAMGGASASRIVFGVPGAPGGGRGGPRRRRAAEREVRESLVDVCGSQCVARRRDGHSAGRCATAFSRA